MATRTASPRLTSIDLLRGIAVLAMIETHVVGLMLRSEFKATAVFDYLDLVNGLVAPAFLFATGFVSVLSSRRLLEKTPERTRRLKKWGWRIAGIWALGYVLRLPGFTPGSLMAASDASWSNFLAVDILQCIAAGWLLLLGLRFVFRTERAFGYACLGATGVIVLVAIPLWSIDFQSSLPAAAAGYLNGLGGSLFPLFPWLAFMTGGAAFGIAYLGAAKIGWTDFLIRWGGRIGLVVAVASYAALFFLIEHMGMAWDVNPLGLTMRFGLVFFVFGLAHRWAKRIDRNPRPIGKGVLQAGRQSLVVYALHLLVLYRAPWGSQSFPAHWGNTLDPWGCIAWTGILVVLMIGLAYAWPDINARLRSLELPVQPVHRTIVGISAVTTVLLLASLSFMA